MASKAWPTPQAHDAATPKTPAQIEAMKASRDHAPGVSNLNEAAAQWPTPAARDWKGSPDERWGQNARPLNEVAKIWSTPRASDGEKGGPNQSFGAGGEPLPSQAATWATPRVSMAKGPAPNAIRTGGRLGHGNIEDQTQRWSTPSVADTTGGRMARSGDRSDEPLLNGQSASLSSRLDPETSTPGEACSTSGRRLNPLFVEWLMGWPPGWTSFASSATGLSLWKRRMRCALSSLASPDAPPAQLSLFG